MGKVAGEVARSFVGKRRSSGGKRRSPGGKRRNSSDLSRSSEWAGMDVTTYLGAPQTECYDEAS